MKRRNFIKLTSTAGAVALFPQEVFGWFKKMGIDPCSINANKKIVLIQLSGANDGLNTIVPIDQYDLYANLRPNIKLNQTGINALIPLDSTLSIENQVGLHPSLTGFKNLYDAGLMRIIQGVGYPSQDKSHFKSTDLWLTGGDGTGLNNQLKSGWVGRFLENYYSNSLNANYPLGIQLGSSENSLGFHGQIEHGLSININGQDPSGYYSIVNGLGGAPPNSIPISEYGNLIQYILNNDTTTEIYAQTISSAFDAGTNSVTYPETNLSNQLKTVARFISGGLKTKVYLVKIGGFDTHNLQVADAANTHLGTHANLLSEVAEAVQSFITDLNNQTLGDDLVALTFSEFGRKIAENGNLGTDHGEVAPMFIFGNSINPGVTGTNINLSEAVSTNNFQVPSVQYDYRTVYSSILQDWLGASNFALDLSLYDFTNQMGFGNQKIPNLFNSTSVVPPNCYSDTLLSLNEFSSSNAISIYPNPVSEVVHITSDYVILEVKILTIEGRKIAEYKNILSSKNCDINAKSFNDGMYKVAVYTSKGAFSKAIIIKH